MFIISVISKIETTDCQIAWKFYVLQSMPDCLERFSWCGNLVLTSLTFLIDFFQKRINVDLMQEVPVRAQ